MKILTSTMPGVHVDVVALARPQAEVRLLAPFGDCSQGEKSALRTTPAFGPDAAIRSYDTVRTNAPTGTNPGSTGWGPPS